MDNLEFQEVSQALKRHMIVMKNWKEKPTTRSIVPSTIQLKQ
jgi:hypothetical protein